MERKYGGLKARNAAVIIQRSFRHYMMVKKFASITAMAKTDKKHNKARLSSSPINSNPKKTSDNIDNSRAAMSSNRTLPSRSLSLRETRNFESSPTSQSAGNISCIFKIHSF